LETICGQPGLGKKWRPFFYGTHSGGEIDLVLDDGRERIAVEFKASSAPDITGTFLTALKDTGIKHAWIIAPVSRSYPSKHGITIGSPMDFIRNRT
jgi:hypothetical protein